MDHGGWTQRILTWVVPSVYHFALWLVLYLRTTIMSCDAWCAVANIEVHHPSHRGIVSIMMSSSSIAALLILLMLATHPSPHTAFTPSLHFITMTTTMSVTRRRQRSQYNNHSPKDNLHYFYPMKMQQLIIMMGHNHVPMDDDDISQQHEMPIMITAIMK